MRLPYKQTERPDPSVEMDRHFGTHAWQQHETWVAIELDVHRDTLAHFGEVATGVVLRRKQRELTGCRAYDLVDMTCERRSAVRIHMNIYKLPKSDVINGTFIHEGRDLDSARIDLLGYYYSGTNGLTDCPRNLNDDPRELDFQEFCRIAALDLDAANDLINGDEVTNFHRQSMQCACPHGFDIHNVPSHLGIVGRVVVVVVVKQVSADATGDNDHNNNDYR